MRCRVCRAVLVVGLLVLLLPAGRSSAVGANAAYRRPASSIPASWSTATSCTSCGPRSRTAPNPGPGRWPPRRPAVTARPGT